MTMQGLIIAMLVAVGSLCRAGEALPRVIVTTFYPLQIAVLNIASGVEGVTVVNLAAPESGCLHDYQLTPRDLATVGRAGVIVANGAGLEAFMGRVVTRYPATKVIDASAGLALLNTAGVTNAHVWVSPVRHQSQVRTIAEGLAAWDPAHAAQYRLNASRYIEELERVRLRLVAVTEAVRVREIVTFHEAFEYFADEFGLRVVAVVEREPGTEPSAGELAGIIRRIRGMGRVALFAEPQFPRKPAEVIARETGGGVYVLDPVVSGPADASAYVKAMERNAAVLAEALADYKVVVSGAHK